MCLVNDLLSVQLIKALVPSDPLDSSNILLEVVAGRTTGGTKGSAFIFTKNSIQYVFLITYSCGFR